MAKRYVAIDVETTGLSPLRGGRVIEIGAVKMDGSCIIEEFQSLIDPGTKITFQAQRIHGITCDMLFGQLKPDQVLPEFRRFVQDDSLVAHNAVFDIAFIRYEFARLGLNFSSTYHCTLDMSRKLFPNLPDHKLMTVYRHLFGEPPDNVRSHRALDDARMAARVWLEVRKHGA